MKLGKTLAVRLTGFLLIMLVPVLAFANIEGMASLDNEALMKKVSDLQMPFIENQGQIKDKSVKFYANTFAGTVFVTDKCEIVYSLQKTDGLKGQKTVSKATAIKESFQCAKQTEVKGIDRSVTKANYFIGSKDDWRTEIPTWKGVNLGKVYKGIELNLKAYGNNVEKLFTVYPEGRVSDIKLKTEGAKGIKINKAGELEIETGLGTVKMTKPVAFQEINGKRVQVAANYTLSGKSGNTYGFQVGEYDRTRPLVIDPLLASTFIGGNSDDSANALVIDSSGNVIIAGVTYSSDYPTTEGAFNTTLDGYSDVIISKFSSDLSTLLVSTFVGGGSASTLAIDSSGNVFIAGYTYSSDYPTTAGAYETTHMGGRDVFISKLDSDLSSLLASTFIGGSSDDYTDALAIDSSGNVFVSGHTLSPDYSVTEGAYDTTCGTDGDCNPYYDQHSDLYYSTDAFVSKLDSNLTSLLASTYIGGSKGDAANALVIDSSGNVLIAGGGSADYPTTEGAFNIDGGGVFISKLDSDLSSLLASTFVGGGSARALAIDSSGNVLIAGGGLADYPTTDGAYETTHMGGSDVFISKLDGNLSSLLASTYIGGSKSDTAYALAIDSSGNVFVAGGTESADYPVSERAYDTTYNGGSGFSIPWDMLGDVMVSKLDSDLTSLLASTFIGGSGYEYAKALAIDSSGNVIIAGDTGSFNYPSTEGAYDTTCETYETDDECFDSFISKLDNDLSEDPAVPDIKANGSDGPLTITHRDTVSITVALSPGSHDGKDADWFVLMETPSGWYHFVSATKTWERGIAVTFQGALFDVETRELWEGSIKRTGDYTFHFKVDTNMNGVMDEDLLYEDSVVVDVRK